MLTSAIMWKSALVVVLIDAPLVWLAWRFVPVDLFRRLKWYLAGAASLVYAALWGVLGSLLYWKGVYSAIFPGWFHWLLPLIYGLLFGALALLFWRISLLGKRGAVLWFILLGGLVSLIGHGIGMSRGLMQVPMLAQTSPISALGFGVVEFTFYWCAITGLAATAMWMGRKVKKT